MDFSSLMTTPQFAEKTGFPISAIYAGVKDGSLPTVQVGHLKFINGDDPKVREWRPETPSGRVAGAVWYRIRVTHVQAKAFADQGYEIVPLKAKAPSPKKPLFAQPRPVEGPDEEDPFKKFA